MEEIIDIERYLDRIESQHKTKPKFMGTVTTVLEKLDPAHAVAKQLPREFYVYEATGAQLDIIGQIVGIDRKFPPVNIPGLPEYLDDDTYRKVILARIVQNQWDGSYEKFREIWDATLRGILDATYYDNQDMTMDVHITGQTPPTLIEMLLRGYIIPKPMGVGMTLTISEEVVSDANAKIKPYVGVWAKINTAKIEMHYPYQAEKVAREEVFTAARLLESAKIEFPMRYKTGSVEARDSVFAGAKIIESGKVEVPLRYKTGIAETNLSIAGGARATMDAARIAVGYHHLGEQQSADTVNCGVKATASAARIAVTIH